MYLNYIYFILIYIIGCYGNDIFPDGSSNNKPGLNLKPSDFHNEPNQRYDWPPLMLRDNVQDIWGKGVINKKLHDWPSVLPWAKANNGFRRILPVRKKRQEAVIDESGLIDLDPLTFNDRHKMALPKVRRYRRIWPYTLY